MGYQHSTQHISMMTSRTILLGLVLAIISFVNCMEIPQELLETEMKAFAVCDTDKMIGLTWAEVEKCEERFKDEIAEMGICLPTKEIFDAFDLDKDGTLLFEEWEEYLESREDDESSVNCNKLA